MAHNLTPVDTFTTTITVPDGGDPVNAANSESPLQALSNRSENNNARLNALPTASDSSIFIPLTGGMTPGSGPQPGFTFGSNADTFTGMLNSLVLATTGWTIDITHLLPPAGANITAIDVRLGGGTGHVGLPDTVPVMSLLYRSPSTGFQTFIGSITDPSADVTAYRVMHDMNLSTGLPHTILANQTYYLVFTGESGTNSIADELVIVSAELSWTL